MDTPINEKTYERYEIPTQHQASFTSLLSSGGQGIVPSNIRNGRETHPDFKLPPGCKVELQIKAVHYRTTICPKCNQTITHNGIEHICQENST